MISYFFFFFYLLCFVSSLLFDAVVCISVRFLFLILPYLEHAIRKRLQHDIHARYATFFFSGLGGEKKLKSLTRFRSRSPSLRVKSRRQSESFYKCSQGIRALCTWGKNTKNAEPRCPARRTKRFNAVWFLSSPPGSSHHILTSVVHAGPLTLTHFIPAQYEKNVTVNLFWNFASPSPFFFPPPRKSAAACFFLHDEPMMTSRASEWQWFIFPCEWFFFFLLLLLLLLSSSSSERTFIPPARALLRFDANGRMTTLPLG